ncbi:uncharacterized protein [Branchiostoma lanceolatum]|uniref:uncharacterized protein n=1 Tax=Branchiostoma lanceolatum TaxID=7740 RepID=UPI0034523B16
MADDQRGGSNDVGKYFFFIKKRVSTGWKDLAGCLGLGWEDVKNISGRNPDDQSRCRDMLEVWQGQKGNAATMEVLIEALSKAGLQSVVGDLHAELNVSQTSPGKQKQDRGFLDPDDEKSSIEGDLKIFEKDMITAGISIPVIVRDIPGIPERLKYRRTTEAAVGPIGGEVEIPGFVKLVVPPGALQRDTMLTVSAVDVAAILRDPESANWISGYPWSLGEDACPRELLDQVLFSPAVDVNLHGAQLNGPVEVQTWRPQASEGMECLLLKHHDGEGWTDITASTEHQIYPDKTSMFLQSFSPVANVWAPFDAVMSVGRTIVGALTSRTLDCRFAAYINPSLEDVKFHVVCRDRCVETDEYLPGFTKCGNNKAMFDLFHGDVLDVAVNVRGGQGASTQMVLRSNHCCETNGQNVQILLDRPDGNPVKGEVTVKEAQAPANRTRTACQFIFKEEGDVFQSIRARKRSGDSPPPCSVPEKKTKMSESATTPRDDGARAGSSGVRRDTAETADMQVCIEKTIAGVSSKWDHLALKLGFSENEIDGIQTSKIDQDRMCREMLRRWRNKNGSEATLRVL